MIITRSPLRISLGGGGTDLPSYYNDYDGFVISAAIDKYIYITIHKTFIDELILKYSKLEKVLNVEQIEHPIIRETLKLLNTDIKSLEISSLADLPAGTGLGSSSSFTTALIQALHQNSNHLIYPERLASMACDVELNKLGEPIGKQDQYISAFGGITQFTFDKDGVLVTPLKISKETLYNLEDNLLLFFTGYSRSASSILKEQDDKTKNNNGAMINNLHFVKELGIKSKVALESANLGDFSELMNIHWQNKKERSKNMSNSKIDEWWKLALKNGALGGKLIGADGGGFLMFYTSDSSKLRYAMNNIGLEEVRFKFDFEGTKVIQS